MRMATLRSLVTVWYWLTLSCYHLSAQQMKERMFYRMIDSSMVGNVTATMKARNPVDCSLLCMRSDPLLCLSFNFGGTLVEGHYTCELSNSERLLEPQKMQQRALFHYYETSFEYLTILYSCITMPCLYNGNCLPGPNPGEYSCECGLEIAVLPFTDNSCNVVLLLPMPPLRMCFMLKWEATSLTSTRLNDCVKCMELLWPHMLSCMQPGKLEWIIAPLVGYRTRLFASQCKPTGMAVEIKSELLAPLRHVTSRKKAMLGVIRIELLIPNRNEVPTGTHPVQNIYTTSYAKHCQV